MGKNVIMVLSGKGGVGKSTVALGTALALAKNGVKVGLLDVDLENPCLAQMVGADPKDLVIGKRIHPLLWYGVEMIGLSFLSEKFKLEDMPVLIAEERKHLTIDQLLNTVAWHAEVIIVDCPPGSGEEIRAFIPKAVAGCIIVTSPQRVSEKAVARTIKMCHHYGFSIIGLVQNNLNNIGGNAGKALSEKYDIPVIARIPWDREIARATEEQRPLDSNYFVRIAKAIFGEKEKTYAKAE
jgi:Mrp family chromosome partitioning ATPase